MTPLAKFNSIIVTLTTLIMYILWAFLNELEGTALGNVSIVLKIIAAVSTLGVYRFLASCLKCLFQKSKLVKKYILGDRYMEGTWVGAYMAKDGSVRYLYETYEQTLEGILISGYSYKEDKTLHGKWKASQPIVDSEKKKITYYYETDMVHNTWINQGFASFTLEKKIKSKHFDKMQGFSSDLHSACKINSVEEKVSDDILTVQDQILEKAEAVYESNKAYLSI